MKKHTIKEQFEKILISVISVTEYSEILKYNPFEAWEVKIVEDTGYKPILNEPELCLNDELTTDGEKF